MIDLGPLRRDLLPEVVSIEYPKDRKYESDKEGVYFIRWPSGTKRVQKPHRWWHSVFWLSPGYEEIKFEERVEAFYVKGFTEIFTYPELRELKFSEKLSEEVRAAIRRHEIRKKMGMEHPFNDMSEESFTPGENTVKTSEYR